MLRLFHRSRFPLHQALRLLVLAVVLIELTASGAPKNVILLIGDGMGPEQVKAAGMYATGIAGSLDFEGLPFKGVVTTYSANNAVTDSAAAATAIATGVKVNNYVISMAYPGDGSELQTLLEYFRDRGRMTGLVTTTYATHATPAAFGAHESDRNSTTQIAGDYLNQTRPNVLLGGGGNGLTPASAQAAGYTVVTDRTGLLGLDTEAATYVSGQFGTTFFPYEYDGLGSLPHLSEMAATALSILDNDPDGFFLMIEGGMIDQACHARDLARAIGETIEFDNAFAAVMAWAQGRDDTLVIVTADHETGGLTVTANNGAGAFPTVTWSTTDHTATNVPVYAWGRGAERIAGVLDNTDFVGICAAPSVELVSPPDKSTLADASATFTVRAYDDAGLSSAALYIGTPQAVLTFSGPAQTDDAELRADSPNTWYGSATSINVDALTPHAHAVMKFPSLIGDGAGQVPSGSTVSSATLKVNCTNLGNAMTMYRLLEDWSETSVTWNSPWTNPGADGSSSHASTGITATCSATGWLTFDLTFFVQEWANGAANYGLVFLDGGTDGIDFDSSESANPPVLTVSLASDWQQVDEVTGLSGTDATISFAPQPIASGENRSWNVVVTSAAAVQGSAPADFSFAADAATTIPALPALTGPADDAGGIGLSPALTVTVNDPDSATVDVIFFGRGNAIPADFELAVLPDTQLYSQDYPAIFTSQTQWIAGNAVARGIEFVTHLGDIVNTWDSTAQWANANTSLSLLDGAVPYGLGMGNHDMSMARDSTYFNQTFPYTRYNANAWYGGSYPAGANDNSYQLITAGGEDWLFLHLAYDPPAAVRAWAGTVLKAHPSRKAVITTHSFLDSATARSAAGTNVWNDVVVPNDNVIAVLCGHISAEACRTDYIGGRAVHQILSDYQGRTNGGDGWLRILGFSPARGQFFVETYSPTLGQYERDPNSQFALDYRASGFVVLGTAAGVSAAGGTASLVWPDLVVFTRHEWYVKVADGDGNTQIGPVWRFTTGAGDTTPPVIADVGVQSLADHSVVIVWTTDEPADSRVDYGLDAGYGVSQSDPALVTAHAITLTDLAAATEYHFAVASKDGSGNESSSGDGTFTTASEQPPAVPAGLIASAGDGTVALDWTDNTEPDLAGYNVYRSETSQGPYSLVTTAGPVGESSYNDATVTNGVTYYYVVTAVDTAGVESAGSSEASASPTDLTPPAVPSGLAATAGDGQIVLDWNDNVSDPDLAGYEVYRSATEGGPYSSIASTNALTSVYTDTGLENGTTYWYVVTAFDLNLNESAQSAPASATPADTTPPAAPTGLGATAGDGFVNLSWAPNGEADLAGYDVYRGTASGSHPDKLNGAPVAGTSFTDTVIVNGVTYYYVVRAVDTSSNQSGDSNEASATPIDVTAPPVPANLTALAGDGQASLDWDDSEGAAAYSVYRSTTLGSGYALVASGLTASDHVDAGLTNGVTYYYVVTATDASSNESGYSDEASATPTDMTPPAVPSGLAATAGDGQVVLDWNDNVSDPDLAGYKVYRSAAAGGPYSSIGSTDAATSAYTDTGIENGTTYWYVVTAFDANDNESAYSVAASATPADTTPPAAPTGLGASAGDGAVQLSWAPNGEVDLAGYDVYRGTAAGSHPDKLNAALIAGTSFTDSAAVNGTTYYYVVRAVDTTANSSGDSNEASATPADATAPPAPANLAAEAGAGQASLDWDDSPAQDLAGYSVYRSTTSGSGYALVAGGLTASAHVDTGLTNGVTYYYVVTAVDASNNESDWSNEASATPADTAFDAYASADPAVTFGAIGGDGWQGTTAAGDGLVQTVMEAPNGIAGQVSLLVEYTLATTAAPADITAMELNAAVAWTSYDAADFLQISILNVTSGLWEDITADIAADGLFAPAAPQEYVGAGGAIRVRFADTAAVKKETKDILTVDLLYAHIAAGPVNQPPTASPDVYVTQEDTTLEVAAPGVLWNDTDPEESPLTAVLASGPASGAVSLNPDGSFTYTPAPNFSGTDAFTYRAGDGSAQSAPATVTIEVGAINDAPVAAADAYTTAKNTPLAVPAPGVLGNDTDADGDALAAALAGTGPAYGVLALNADGSFTYTPDQEFVGEDSFAYVAGDGLAQSEPATVTITITPVNTPPVAVGDGYATAEDTPLVVAALDGVLANDTDGDLDPLAAVLVSGPSHGALVLNADGSFTYEPAADWYGEDSFTYKANDGYADSNVATVAIAVSAVNDAPVAADDAYTTAQNTQLAVAAPGVLGNDGDVDGDPLAAVLLSGPSNGTLVLNADGSFTYDPAADWTGVDQFTYAAGDGTAESEIATVTITVTSSSMTVSVASIATGLVPAGQNTKDEVRVTLAPAIAGATVTGDWTFNGALLVAGTAGITDANGIAVIQSVPIKAKSGDVYGFTVTNVEAAGYVYDPAANVVSSASIVMP